MNYAYFNEHGDVTSVSNIPFVGVDHVEVPVGTIPSENWIDPDTREMFAREPLDPPLPDRVDWTVGVEIPALDRCAVYIDGVKAAPGSTYLPSAPGRHLFEVKGRFRQVTSIVFADYAENRRAEYPPIADQLDMIFHDPERWRDIIQAVKEKYPK